jgi:hypothetical protein
MCIKDVKVDIYNMARQGHVLRPLFYCEGFTPFYFGKQGYCGTNIEFPVKNRQSENTGIRRILAIMQPSQKGVGQS